MQCFQWASMGYCDAGHSHESFMKGNCASACEAASRRGEAKAPPFDIFVLILLAGFGYAVYHAARCVRPPNGLGTRL